MMLELLAATALCSLASVGGLSSSKALPRAADSSSVASTSSALTQDSWQGYISTDSCSAPLPDWVYRSDTFLGFDVLDPSQSPFTFILDGSSVSPSSFELNDGHWAVDVLDTSRQFVQLATFANAFDSYANPVGPIGDGLSVVTYLASGFNNAFEKLFYPDGAISDAGIFAFTLMGLGVGVGVVQLCFEWITGRHGM